MGHDHHDHHHHDHAPSSYGFAFGVGVSLNLAFVVTETVFGVASHSMALVADAGHNLGDVLSLSLAWGASILARRAPTQRRTYGFRSTTILASVVNAVVLLVVTGGIVWESLRRFVSPAPVAGRTVILVSLVGVAINTVAAFLFMSGRKRDLNVRSAFMHLAADALLSLGVAVAGGVILWTDWLWLDPLVSVILAITILVGTWSLLKSSVNLVLDAVPEGIDPEAVRSFLASLPGVKAVHDLHIWGMSTTEIALTAHLVMPGESSHPRFLGDVCKTLHDRFGIEHATLQVEEPAVADSCRLAPEHTV